MKSLLISTLLVCLVGSVSSQNEFCKRFPTFFGFKPNCCVTDRPMYCSFLKPSEKKQDDKCACIPDVSFATKNEGLCAWDPTGHYSTKNGTITPCIDFGHDCNVPRGTLPSAFCYIGYPPPARVMHYFEDQYCNFMKEKSNGLEFLPDEMIYDVFFTCWLYDCGNRLEKPREIRNRRDKLQWCYPPILPGDNRLKYCNLYTRDTNLYVATPLRPYNHPPVITPPRVTGKLCALPPVCKDEHAIIDQNLYMLPWIEGTADRFYCERMCPEIGPNDGRFPNVVTGALRLFLMREVIPNRTAIPFQFVLLLAGVTEFPREAYTDGNPYGHTRCIPPRDCRDSETPTTMDNFDQCPLPCVNSGYCSLVKETFSCICSEGYTGDQCELQSLSMSSTSLLPVWIGLTVFLIVLVFAILAIWWVKSRRGGNYRPADIEKQNDAMSFDSAVSGDYQYIE